MTRWIFAATVVLVVFGAGCASVPDAPWEVNNAERLVWIPDDEHFAQDWALETSGLAFAGDELVAPSEKYGRLLFFNDRLEARVVSIGVPRHAELEGVAHSNGSLFLCDEAHATVYRVDLEPGAELLPKLAAIELTLEDVEISGGKIGVEGIEVTDDGREVLLLLERSGDPSTGCVSRLWRLKIGDQRLRPVGPPVDISLEDCNWRLTGLAWMEDRLLGLKTQYPGSRYEIVEIDIESGSIILYQDLTEYLRGVREDGWGNNVEGVAIDAEGALWLIADNAVTGVIDDEYPPQTDERALLLKIPVRAR